MKYCVDELENFVNSQIYIQIYLTKVIIHHGLLIIGMQLPGNIEAANAVVKKEYDFYISATDGDDQHVSQVRDMFLQHKPELKFYLAKRQDEDTDDAVFNVMRSCRQ